MFLVGVLGRICMVGFAGWGLLSWFCINLDCSVKFGGKGLLRHGLLDRILPSQVCMVSFTGLCLVCRNLYVLFAGWGLQSQVGWVYRVQFYWNSFD